jgi:catechol 2,3-dioxygenase-like lactoylglutathione lyase family enzyme
MHHVGVVVSDLDAALAFFVALGLERGGEEMRIEGEEVDRIIGLEGVRNRVAFVRTPDGHNRLELIEFLAPPSPEADAAAPSHALGVRHLTFAVDDVEATLERLRPLGAELVGELVEFGGYRLCYLRGPDGIIVEVAQQLG